MDISSLRWGHYPMAKHCYLMSTSKLDSFVPYKKGHLECITAESGSFQMKLNHVYAYDEHTMIIFL